MTTLTTLIIHLMKTYQWLQYYFLIPPANASYFNATSALLSSWSATYVTFIPQNIFLKKIRITNGITIGLNVTWMQLIKSIDRSLLLPLVYLSHLGAT